MRTAEQRQARADELKKEREQHVATVNAIDGYLKCLADEDAAEQPSPVVMPPASPHTEGKGE